MAYWAKLQVSTIACFSYCQNLCSCPVFGSKFSKKTGSSVTLNFWSVLSSFETRKPNCRWQTRATRKHAKNCSNSTCLQRCRWQYWSFHPFSCCCVRNLRNPEKFSENSIEFNVINFGVNWTCICNFLLVTKSNFGRISYSFRDTCIDI